MFMNLCLVAGYTGIILLISEVCSAESHVAHWKVSMVGTKLAVEPSVSKDNSNVKSIEWQSSKEKLINSTESSTSNDEHQNSTVKQPNSDLPAEAEDLEEPVNGKYLDQTSLSQPLVITPSTIVTSTETSFLNKTIATSTTIPESSSTSSTTTEKMPEPPKIPPIDLKTLPDVLQMIKLIPNMVRTLGGVNEPINGPNLLSTGSFGNAGSLFKMLTGKTLASNDPIPLSTAVSPEYGTFPLQSMNLGAFGQQEQTNALSSISPFNRLIKPVDSNQYSGNEFNVASQSALGTPIIPLTAKFSSIIDFEKTNVDSNKRINLRRGSAEAPTPPDTETELFSPLTPQQRRLNSTIQSKKRPIMQPHQFGFKSGNHPYNTMLNIELTTSSPYIAPMLPAHSLTPPIPHRPKPRFDLSKLTENEVRQLESIHQKLSNDKNENETESGNKNEEDEEQYEEKLETTNNSAEDINIFNNGGGIPSKLKYLTENSENVAEFNSELNANEQLLQHGFTREEPKSVQRNEGNGLYFIKELKETSINAAPRMNKPIAFSDGALKTTTLKPTITQQFSGLNALEPHIINDLMAIKDLPDLDQLTRGMDLSLLNKPGGFAILKQQFIQRLMERSLMSPSINRKLNDLQPVTDMS